MAKSRCMSKSRPHRVKHHKAKKSEQISAELKVLATRIAEESPDPGDSPPLEQRVAFRALPLSEPTLRGLESAKPPFATMTAIQNACIPHALAGRDILGAARTGSGKTLAFLVPVLESLYRHRFGPSDGCGAAILSPTRELAVQIFQVLRTVGKQHTLSVGLLIGGKKDFYEEQAMVWSTNIIIATPGRLLQHLEQTPYFDMSGLKILVLDEADLILDMGFQDQLIRILRYLPAVAEGDLNRRQTLLFSATQTRDVKQLATLSLNQPEYLGVHDKEKNTTPEGLEQLYIVVPLEHKLNAVYSFIKSHLKSKSIIFMASCAQVRHAWELFCSLRPGVIIMALHGKLIQTKRTQIYFDYLQRPHAVLFATDVASRGLDFEAVDWVVHVDAPEDRDMYIHRVGRTARYKAGGKSLLFLTPLEDKKGYIDYLHGGKKFPLNRLSINPNKTVVVTQQAASMVASDDNLRKLAKKACQSYIRSIYLMPNDEIFDVTDLPVRAFGESLGLESIPSTSRLTKVLGDDRAKYRETKNVNRKLEKLKQSIKEEKLAKKLAKFGEVPGINHLEAKFDNSDEEEDDFIVKSTSDWNDDGKEEMAEAIGVGGSNAGNKHTRFGDVGEEVGTGAFLRQNTEDAASVIDKEKKCLKEANEAFMQKVRKRLEATASLDHAKERERIRQKHKKHRLLQKEEREDPDADEEPTATSGNHRYKLLEDGSSDSGGSDAASDGGSDSESSDRVMGVKAQEEIVLSLVRGG